MNKKVLALAPIVAVLLIILPARAVQFDYGQFEGLPYERPPLVSVLSPSPNGIYNMPDVPVNVTVQIFGFIYHNMEHIKWLNYSLDGQTVEKMRLIIPREYPPGYYVYGNDMLTGLSDGTHNLTIYGKTAIGGTAGTFNETVAFTVDTSTKPIAVSFPTLLAVAVTITVVVAVSLLVYFIERKQRQK